MDFSARTDHLPQSGETVRANGFLTSPGGKGANQAVASARLGSEVRMIGCIGDDSNGQKLKASLVEEGIDCRAVIVSPTQPTGLALIVVDRGSRNSIVVVGGSNDEMLPYVIQQHQDAVTSADVVVCQLEIPLETVSLTLKLASDAGKITVLNPAPVLAALPSDCYNTVDWLVPNELEAAALSGMHTDTNEDVIRAGMLLLDRGPKNVLITLGERGVVWIKRDCSGEPTVRFFPCSKVEAIDTTAAGDTFVGALAAALAGGRSEIDAISFGQAAAAISVTRSGAQASIPRLSEIRE